LNLIENFLMAISSIFSHKLRSILTMLGVIIGVSSVILIVAIGQGGEELIKSQITGSNNILEVYYEPLEENSAMEVSEQSKLFTEEDLTAVSKLNNITDVSASGSNNSNVQYKGNSTNSTINAINDSYIKLKNLRVNEGSIFQANQFTSRTRICIISEKLKKSLFKNEKVVGKVIWINYQPVKVIGVMEGKDSLLSFNINEVYIPDTSYKVMFGDIDYTELSVKVDETKNLKKVGLEVESTLNKVNNSEGTYKVSNLEQISSSISSVTKIMTFIIASIASISLIVGGIGVMNMMLVSVTERTKEIGIRKALGAKRTDILLQFLVESVTITLVGGILGILFGVGSSKIISSVAGWPSLVSWEVILLGIIFSMFIGILFGILPANKAAKMNPIDALNQE